MTVALLFPPGADPRAPYLALPSLAAALRREGISVTMRDLNLEGLLYVLRQDNLDAARTKCVENMERLPQGERKDRLGWALLHGENLISSMDEAIESLRDPRKFYDPNCLNWARDCISVGANLAAAGLPRSVYYDVVQIKYDVEGINPVYLSDLINGMDDPGANVFHDFYEQEVLPCLKLQEPTLVGISINNSQQILPGLMAARLLKKHGFFVVIGGTLYTKFVPQLQKHPAFFQRFCNGLIAYEGETALLELLTQLHGSHDFFSVPNYLYLDNQNTVRVTQTHTEDLNTLPTPDFTGLPLDYYLAPSLVLPILMGKGCYYNRCKFCDISYINRLSPKPYRVRSVEKIAEDIHALAERFGAHHFVFTDEAIPPKLLLKLTEVLKSNNQHRYNFTAYARLEPGFTKECCRRISEMGMQKLFFGLESGSQETLDHMCKGIRLTDVRDVLSNCLDADIYFHLFSIIGFPEETESRARETLSFFLKNADIINRPGNSFDIHPFLLAQLTPYFEKAEDLGAIIDYRVLQGKDFPTCVHEREWTNKRGLGPDEVTRLLKEFYQILRKTFPDYHNCPFQFWPAFEEYAILYAAYYKKRPFHYRTSLPHRGDNIPYLLRWNPINLLLTDEGRYSVSNLAQSVLFDRDTFHRLSSLSLHRHLKPIDEIMSSLLQGKDAKKEVELREYIDGLIGLDILQLDPSPSQGQDANSFRHAG